MVWVGSQSRLMFAHEDTRGTRPEAFGGTVGEGSASPRLLGITNQGAELPDLQQDIGEYPSIGTGRRLFANAPRRRAYGAVTLNFLPTTAELFYLAFGTEVFQEDIPAAGTNTHTLMTDAKATIPTDVGATSETTTENATELPPWSLAAILNGDPDFRRTFLGGVVDSMTWTLSESQELQVGMDFLMSTVEDHTADPPTLLTQPTDDGTGNPVPYQFHDSAALVTLMGSYDFTNNTISGGRTVAAVRGFSCALNNNIKQIYVKRDTNSDLVWKFVSSRPDFSFSIDITPSHHVTSTEDAIYDLLEGNTKGDVLIPFQRATDDRLDFVFEDCLFRQAPHPIPDDGSETNVRVNVSCTDFRIVSRDTLASYPTL